VLDATRCISYLTIELRDAIPAELRPGLGDWIFGCDVCQDVCPWNHRAPISGELAFQPQANENPVDLLELFTLDDAGFRARFRHSPLWRAKRRGLLRNAALILGNQRATPAIPVLLRALHDPEPLIRGAVAWSLGRFPGLETTAALENRLAVEENPQVRAEIQAALEAH
jgi:epoxyqueuosine reductase